MIIDNIETIRGCLEFDDPNEFYYITIMQRKKDGINTISSHDGARRIRTFCIYSLEEFDKIIPFLKGICDKLKARAYIDLRRKNTQTIQLDCIEMLLQNYRSGSRKTRGLFDSAIASSKSRDRLWMIDVDTKDMNIVDSIIEEVISKGAKYYGIFNTVNGFHIIIGKFDSRDFKSNEIRELKKDPLTLLYFNDISSQQE